MKPTETTPRLLIAAGPTYEPIDSVRFIGNRSSGKLGIGLALEASRRGWDVIILLGPNTPIPEAPGLKVIGFRSTADLQGLLQSHMPQVDALIMAAAVADFRMPDSADLSEKLQRTEDGYTLNLVPTPDLLAECSVNAREDQFLVGFALEPRDRLMESAWRKLGRKNIDLIVANPLETMDSDEIEATLLGHADRGVLFDQPKQVHTTKAEFAKWLLEEIAPLILKRIQKRMHAKMQGDRPPPA